MLSLRKKRAIVCAVIYSEICINKKTPKKRSIWQKKWLNDRNMYSDVKLLQELRDNDPIDYKNYLRMDAKTFDALLHRVRPYLQKQDPSMRQSIPPEERLVATLRFLATGRSYEDLKFSTGISAQALGYIIPETCKVIFEVLKEECLKFPSTKEEWKEVAEGFQTRWQIPNCGGAIDGKHIRICPPSGTAALYYNYKQFYSMVLMAIVNSKYEFIFVDIGKNGRISDGGVLQYTNFYQRLLEDLLNLPEKHECRENLNFVFIGDEAFSLHRHILKPFSQKDLNYERRIFNYRLARGRNVVENVFGLIAARFRVLHTAINMDPINIQYVVLAVCILHNYLIKTKSPYVGGAALDSESNQTHELLENGEWRQNDYQFTPLQVTGIKNFTFDAKLSRNEYVTYFNGNGKVSWQDEMLNKGKA